jgi:hypothetical protein
MEFDFKKVMEENSDEELVKIVTVYRTDYQDEAIIAAEDELRSRNLSLEQTENYKITAEKTHAQDIKKANEPLETPIKIVTAIFPMIITFILSGFYKSKGYDKKAKDLIMWTFVGFAAYIFLIALFSMLGGC